MRVVNTDLLTLHLGIDEPFEQRLRNPGSLLRRTDAISSEI